MSQMFRAIVSSCVIAFAMLGCSGIVGGQTDFAKSDAQVVVESDAAKREKVYRLADGACQISWTVFDTQVNEGIIQQRTTCPLPMNQQLSLVSRILEKMLSDEPARKFRTLYLGRLASFPGMPARLAILAQQSSDWDSRAGRPKSGRIDRFVIRVANQGQMLQEWQEMFQRFNWDVEVSGVEKVSVSRASDLPFFKQLQEKGIEGADRMPFDCEVWLAVTKR